MTIEEWAKDFKSYVYELQIPRDDYKGIMSYIDDALAMMKEQEEKMKHLNNITLEYEKEVFKLQNLLKEQEAELCDRCGRRLLKSNREVK